MMVVIPYVTGGLTAETVAAVTAQGYGPELVLLTDPVGGYGRLLDELAARGEDVAIVEQDKVSRPGLLDELARCPRWFCWHAYPIRGVPAAEMDRPGLGHVRLRGEAWRLLRRHPLAAVPFPCDAQLADWLAAHGVAPHRHLSVVGHRHPAQ